MSNSEIFPGDTESDWQRTRFAEAPTYIRKRAPAVGGMVPQRPEVGGRRTTRSPGLGVKSAFINDTAKIGKTGLTCSWSADSVAAILEYLYFPFARVTTTHSTGARASPLCCSSDSNKWARNTGNKGERRQRWSKFVPSNTSPSP
jgi:hypothetical protein